MQIKKIFDTFKQNQTAKVLLGNFTYLSILKCLGLLFPLITYPIVIRTVGAEKYGLVVYAHAIISYFIVFINFGFDVSATRKCSENRGDKVKLSSIYSSVILLKASLFLIALFITIPILFLTHYDHTILLLFLLGLCLQEIFFPIWLFQGLEVMKYITIISFASSCLYVILLLLFIKDESDYYLIAIFQSLGGILTSILSSILLRKQFGVRFVRVSFSQLKLDFKESVPFFASRFSAIVMEKSNLLVIGHFFSYNTVAIYDLCAKIVSMLQMPFSLVAQVLYPNVAKTKNMSLVKRLIKPVLGTALLMCLLTICFSKYIVLLLGGSELLPAIPILCLMVWYAPLVGVNYLLGASTLVVCGYSKQYNLSVIYSVMFYLAIVGFLIACGWVNLYTMALSFVLPELFVTCYRSYVTKKNNLLNSSK